jgi:hypothetical protein
VPLRGRHKDAQTCVQSPCVHHESPRAEQIVNLTLSRCQQLPQGVSARRRLFIRPAWLVESPWRTLLWHDHQRASRKPVPPFPSSLSHHASPRAEQIPNQTLSRCQRLSQGVGARRRLSNGIPFYRGSVRSHSRAGVGLVTTVKYPQCITTQRQENHATHNERCREQRTGHLDEVSATHNEQRAQADARDISCAPSPQAPCTRLV